MHHRFYHIGLKAHFCNPYYGLSYFKPLFLFADGHVDPLALDTTGHITIFHDGY